jgi:integrase
MTITEAAESLIKKKEGKNFRQPTLRTWRHELLVLEKFMATRGRFLVSEIEPEDLIDFRASWGRTWKSGVTRQRTQQTYRAFLNHVCHDAQRLKLLKDTLDPIKLQQQGKLRLKPQPFSEAELRKLLVNVPVVFASNPPMIAKMTALIHCQAATGLSISDALQLQPRNLDNGWLNSYRQKTDKIAKQRLNPALRQELLEVGKDNPRYIFWVGQRKRKTRKPGAGTDSGILEGAALINQTLLFPELFRVVGAVDQTPTARVMAFPVNVSITARSKKGSPKRNKRYGSVIRNEKRSIRLRIPAAMLSGFPTACKTYPTSPAISFCSPKLGRRCDE